MRHALHGEMPARCRGNLLAEGSEIFRGKVCAVKDFTLFRKTFVLCVKTGR